MQEGQDQDFEFASDNIGDRATTEYFSKVEGGKKNKEKIVKKRTRFTRKALFIILGVIIALTAIFITIFTIINISNKNIGKRTNEELPSTIVEVQRRAYKAANATGRYYDGIVYLGDLILDMQDSNIDPEFIFETEVYLARFIYEAGDAETAVSLLEDLENQEYLTDLQKYWLYGGLIDIYTNEDNTEKVKEYQELFDKLDVHNNYVTFGPSSGGGSNE